MAVLEELVKISGINFERFCLDTNYWLLNIKQNTKQKQQQKTQQLHKVLKDFPPNLPHFSDGFFICSLPVPMFKEMFCTHSSRLLRLSFVKCHLFLKAIVYFELFVAISFSIPFALLISAMRLLIWMNCFSLDL